MLRTMAQQMRNTNTNVTPHQSPELKNQNMKCCWVAACMKRHNVQLAQITQNSALRCIRKKGARNSEGIATTPTHPPPSPSDNKAANSAADCHVNNLRIRAQYGESIRWTIQSVLKYIGSNDTGYEGQ